MNFRRIALALATLAALGPASAADLLTVYRDAQVSDPVYQSARAQYTVTLENLPQARAGYLPLIAGSASVFVSLVLAGFVWLQIVILPRLAALAH